MTSSFVFKVLERGGVEGEQNKSKINTEYLIIEFLVMGAEIKKGGVSPAK
jgi:hypothetical protein